MNLHFKQWISQSPSEGEADVYASMILLDGNVPIIILLPTSLELP